MRRMNNIPKGHMGSTIKFLSTKDKELFLKDLHSKSQIMKLFDSWSYQDNFNIEEVNFRDTIIEELLKKNLINEKLFSKHGRKLEKLHLSLNDEYKNLDESEQNKISISFYETSKNINNLYVKFIKDIISPYFKDPVYYQAVPTFRFHFPNQLGYNWKDRYHTDIMLGHPPYEINIWLPFTKTYDSNSIRITPYEESMNFLKSCNYDFELFAEQVQYNDEISDMLRKSSNAINMNYGQFIMFDPRCLHCTQHNITNDTRVSMDIRIITKEELRKYSRQYRTTGRKKMLFTPDNYFSNKPV